MAATPEYAKSAAKSKTIKLEIGMDFGGKKLSDIIEEARGGRVNIVNKIISVKLTHKDWAVVMSDYVTSYNRVFNQVSIGTYVEIPNLVIGSIVDIDVVHEALEMRDNRIKSTKHFSDGRFRLLFINRTDKDGREPVSFQYIFSDAEFTEKQA